MSDALLSSLTAGLLAGYAIAIPVGAIAALLITHGARHGGRVAAGGALGAATVDGLYATIAVVAGAAIAPVIVLIEEPLRWLSVIVLVALGVVIALPGLRSAAREGVSAPEAARAGVNALEPASTGTSAPAHPITGSSSLASGSATQTRTIAPARTATQARAATQTRTTTQARTTVQARTTAQARRTPHARTTTARRLFLTVAALTLVNPVTVVYFAALVGSSTLAHDATPLERIVFVSAAFAASLSWQLLLTTAGALAGRALVGPVGARITALLGGGIIILLAVRAALGL